MQIRTLYETVTALIACCILTYPVFGQERIDEATLSDHFEHEGFQLVGYLPGIRPTSAPVRTEAGLFIAGIPQYDTNRPNDVGLIWHLDSGNLDFIAPPVLEGDEIADRHTWARFGSLNERGDMACSTGWFDAKHRKHHTAFVRSDDQAPRLIEHPSGTITHPQAINDRGQVLGILKRGKGQSGLACVWSVKSGVEPLPTPEGSRAMSYDLNNLGDVVGGIWGKTIRPAVWLATDDPEPTHRLLELPLRDDWDTMIAVAINDARRVLIDATLAEEDAVTRSVTYTKQPYTWTLEEGLKPIKIPDYGHVIPLDIDEHGAVLLKARGPKQANPRLPVHHYYLHREGRSDRLPLYPDADHTDYLYLSKDGLIAGVARFFADKHLKKKPADVIGFVLKATQGNDRAE